MSTGTDRSGSAALQAAARLPAYIVLSLLIVAVAAGGLLAARGQRADTVAAAATDTDESSSPLPTPVPVASATPLPTPAPLGQTVIVDTAVAFWVDFIPEELAEEYRDAILAAGGIPALRPSPAARVGDAQSAGSPGGTSVGASADASVTAEGPGVLVAPSLGGGVAAAAATPAPLPAPPLPPDAALPVPLPSVPLPIPTPTLPPLLP